MHTWGGAQILVLMLHRVHTQDDCKRGKVSRGIVGHTFRYTTATTSYMRSVLMSAARTYDSYDDVLG